METTPDLTEEPGASSAVCNRVQLPLIRSTHPAAPGEELTPDRAAQILLEDEVRWAFES